MDAAVPSWVEELAAVVNMSTARPVGTRATRNDQKPGIIPVPISSTLNASDVTSSSRRLGRARRAATSAPPSAPTAKAADAIPNAPAPVWNTSRDISAMVTWKFIPNVATKNISTSGIHSAGLART
jgi:hypothetical protein